MPLITIEVHHYIHDCSQAEPCGDRLSVIEGKLDRVLQEQDKLMADFSLATAALAALNETTNQLANVVGSVIANDEAEDNAFRAEIQTLKDKIAAGEAVEAADVASLEALVGSLGSSTDTLKAVKTALDGMGASPADPLPPVEVEPLPPVEPTE